MKGACALKIGADLSLTVLPDAGTRSAQGPGAFRAQCTTRDVCVCGRCCSLSRTRPSARRSRRSCSRRTACRRRAVRSAAAGVRVVVARARCDDAPRYCSLARHRPLRPPFAATPRLRRPNWRSWPPVADAAFASVHPRLCRCFRRSALALHRNLPLACQWLQ